MNKVYFLITCMVISLNSFAMDISTELYNTAKAVVEAKADERTGEMNYVVLSELLYNNDNVSEVVFTSSYSTSVTDYSFDEGEPVIYEVIYNCTDLYSYVVKTKEVKYLSGSCY